MNILVVEDNENSRIILKKILESEGHDVATANNGREAFDLAIASPPDMIISDILMPVMDGFALCRECKGNKKLQNIPFIFYTATYTDEKDEELASEIGADLFLRKPLEPVTLIAIVREIIEETRKGRVPPENLNIEREEVLKLYSERLVSKLEKKMLDLEREIAEHRQVEIELKDSYIRFKTVMDNIEALIYVADINNHRILYLNKYGRDVFGDVEGKLCWKTIQTGQSGPCQFCSNDKLLDKDGKPTGVYSWEFQNTLTGKWYDCRDSAIRWIDGALARIEIATDITKRKKTEEALRESEEKYRAIFESVSEGILIADRETRELKYANPAICSMLGYRKEELEGVKISEIHPKAELDHVISEFQSQARGEKTLAEDIPLLRKDGTVLYADIRTNNESVLIDGSQCVVGCITDITERKLVDARLVSSNEKLQIALEGTIRALATMSEWRDPYTAGHQKRVEELACAIAQEMKLPEDRIKIIKMAALVHDIGKISVPTEILSKPGRLSESEFRMIQIHSEVGHDILKGIDFPWPIAGIILQHHERMDGSGYPRGLSGQDITIEARIMAVADVVEAMASHRPYRPASTVEEALHEISRNKGILYDPEVADACLKIFADKRFSLKAHEWS